MSAIFMFENNTQEESKQDRTKRHKRRASSLIKRIKRKVRKDPFKILSAVIGGLLLIVITILFIMYSREAATKKIQLQKTEMQ